ncbi:hypothetical protein AB1Y20_012769 [Prymnesium parvum]|uniref:Peroxisomal membrane protein MPV17 n=1 Tax=Prymnesium parvum TaxID=97485 RepID=A0AB34IJL1_PRYPA
MTASCCAVLLLLLPPPIDGLRGLHAASHPHRPLLLATRPPPSSSPSLHGGVEGNSLARPSRRYTSALDAALARLWRRYTSALDAAPMRVRMATAAVLGSLSDAIAQGLEGGQFALARHLALILVNVVYITPLLSLFYAANEWLVGEKLGLPASGWRGTGVRLAVDQLLYAPLCIYGFFWAYGLSEAVCGRLPSLGGLPAQVPLIRAQIQREYRAMLLSNWQLWVLPQLVNFRWMPPRLRLPFGSLVALLWGVIQSIIANR